MDPEMTMQQRPASPQSADAEWRRLAERIRNWGRWGDDDELGTLNHITPQIISHAATLARTGRVIPLGVPFDAYGPQGAHGLRRNPIHLMILDGGDETIADRIKGWGGAAEAGVAGMFAGGPAKYNDDYIIMACQAGTQWDALSHVYYDGHLYNGYPSGAVTGLGATKDGIDPVARRGHVVGRGVLLDVARHRGVDQLPPSTAISPSDLDEVAESQRVEIRDGDIIVVRTGWWREFLANRDGDAWLAGSPGLSWRCAGWLYDHNCAAVAADNMAVEVMPPEDGIILNFHMLALRDLGMVLGEIWDLEALSVDCAADGVYEFMLVATALPLTGAVGTPINPIAIK
jgi:kynurenine formamidase